MCCSANSWPACMRWAHLSTTPHPQDSTSSHATHGVPTASGYVLAAATSSTRVACEWLELGRTKVADSPLSHGEPAMLPVTAAGPKYAQCDVMSLLDHHSDMGSGRRGVCRAPRLMVRMGASGHCMGHWGALGVILSVVHTSGVLTGTMGHTGGHGRRRWSGQIVGS